jgi:uncharacterized protein YjcR
MAHDRDLRRKVRASYVQGLALTTAAEVNGVSYQTARNWKRHDGAAGHDWDIARQARLMSKSGMEEMANLVLEQLADQFVATLAALKADSNMPADKRASVLVQLMDGYNKAIGAASRAMPNANRLATAMEVIKFLTVHIAEQAPELRERFIEVIEGAGEALVAEFGAAGA